MYYQYFGLTEAPFSIAVNPRYLFMSARHRDALAHLLYGVGAGGGFILLTGEVGTGKTTINRCLLEQLPQDTDVAIILNPALNAMELLASVCDELGIAYDAERHTLKTLTDKLHAFLLDNHARGRKTVLMIDEAQHLDFEVLEQIRLLTNLETNSEKLLQIILIGQPELAEMLSRPELRQLNQRITARYNLEPLNLEETGAYIRHRLQVAGMTAGREIFPRAVIRGIYQRTRGIPRLINVLCDRILLGAYGRNRTRADQAMLDVAAREVLGEAGGEGRGRVWAGAALVLLAALGAGGWYLYQQGWWRHAVQPPVAAATREPAVAAAPVVVPPERSPPAPQIPAVEAPVVAAADPGPEAPMAAIATAPAAEAPGWLLPPAAAMAQLWSLASDAPEPIAPCAGPVQAGLACVEGEALTWDDLARLERPLLLDMVTTERFAAATLLLGVEGRSAWVATGDGVASAALADLGPRWTGRYRFLWRPPAGYERPLAVGDESGTVAEVAELFARLDGQQQPLAGERFNASLQQRVRLFQREHGLAADGVVGIQTLLKLNQQLGVDVSAAEARVRLGGDMDEVVQR
ncbi:MAG: AAA family ATPase [Halioglobus sp.]|jgi:general secretion pathway protein A